MLVNITGKNTYNYQMINPNVETNSDTRREKRGKEQYGEEIFNRSGKKEGNPPIKDDLPKLITTEEVEAVLFLGVRGMDYRSIHTNVGNHINVEV